MAKQGKERIITAAFQLFLENGYKGVGLNDIIEKTGLSKGAIYHHFDSKYAIYLAAIEEYFFKILPNDISGDEHLNIKERLRFRFVFFLDMIDFVEQQGEGISFPIRNYFIFQLESERDEQILENVQMTMNKYRDDMTQFIQNAMDKKEITSVLPASIIAQQVMSMMEGLAIHHSAVEKDCKTFLMEKYDEVIVSYLDLLLIKEPSLVGRK